MTSSALLDPCVDVTTRPWLIQEAWRVSRKFPLVLLAEDQRDMRELIAETLVDEGYEVVQVEDGVGLLEVLGEAGLPNGERPDLVITDVRMPGLSGLDAISELRQVDPLVPVVVISAFVDAATRSQSRELGVAVVMDKPFPMHALVHWVRRLAPPASF